MRNIIHNIICRYIGSGEKDEFYPSKNFIRRILARAFLYDAKYYFYGSSSVVMLNDDGVLVLKLFSRTKFRWQEISDSDFGWHRIGDRDEDIVYYMKFITNKNKQVNVNFCSQKICYALGSAVKFIIGKSKNGEAIKL